MPCADDSKYAEEWRRKHDGETIEQLIERLDNALDRLSEAEERRDKLARMLCEFIQEINEEGPDNPEFFMSNELKEWWADHQKFDAKRMKKEALQEEMKLLNEKLWELGKQIQDLDKG